MRKRKESHTFWGYIGTAIGAAAALFALLLHYNKTAFALTCISILVYLYAAYRFMLEKYNFRFFKSFICTIILCMGIFIHLFIQLLEEKKNESTSDNNSNHKSDTSQIQPIKNISPDTSK
jgi:glycerol uptake facilitator-like aquaporin